MFKAGLKKELMFFLRGFRVWGLLLIVLGLAASYPAMMKMLEVMTEQAQDMLGTDMPGYSDIMQSTGLTVASSPGQMGFLMGVSALVGAGMLVTMLLFMGAAGGEQKKRSIIIPNCAGLTPHGYVLPKFVLYPILTVIVMFLATFLAGLVSNLLFGNSVTMQDMLFSGACVAGYGLFEITLFFMLGICLGRPGISVVIVYLGSELLAMLINGFNAANYNPYALYNMIGVPYEQADMNNFTLSMIVTVVLSVIFCLITLMVAGLKKIDNSDLQANL